MKILLTSHSAMEYYTKAASMETSQSCPVNLRQLAYNLGGHVAWQLQQIHGRDLRLCIKEIITTLHGIQVRRDTILSQIWKTSRDLLMENAGLADRIMINRVTVLPPEGRPQTFLIYMTVHDMDPASLSLPEEINLLTGAIAMIFRELQWSSEKASMAGRWDYVITHAYLWKPAWQEDEIMSSHMHIFET